MQNKRLGGFASSVWGATGSGAVCRWAPACGRTGMDRLDPTYKENLTNWVIMLCLFQTPVCGLIGMRHASSSVELGHTASWTR